MPRKVGFAAMERNVCYAWKADIGDLAAYALVAAGVFKKGCGRSIPPSTTALTDRGPAGVLDSRPVVA